VGLAGLAFAAAVVVVGLRRPGAPGAPTSGTRTDRSGSTVAAPAMPDSGARRAYQKALAVAKEGRPFEALRHFERALELGLDRWPVHSDYASALSNAALESHRWRGRPRTATRSSTERTELVIRALHQLNAADRLSTTPQELAWVRVRRGQLLGNWGLSWDALLELDGAVASDPAWPVAANDRLHQLLDMGLSRSFPSTAR
jgi:hypothetical protein